MTRHLATLRESSPFRCLPLTFVANRQAEARAGRLLHARLEDLRYFHDVLARNLVDELVGHL